MDKIKRIKRDECAIEELFEYITDNDVNVAIAAAESEKATGPILDIAARDNDKRVRMAALKNKNIEVNTLELLAHDEDYEIVEMAVKLLEGR